MFRTWFCRWYNNIILLIYIQIILLFVYMPILIYWGLPISYMSILGNLIFLPFLTVFLFLATLLFCTELFQIPNNALSYILNHCVENWFKLLQLGSPKWLIGFAYPGLLPLLLIPIIGWAVYSYPRKIKLKYKCISGLCTIIIICFSLKWLTPTPATTTLLYRNKKIFVQNNKQLTIILPRMRLHATGFQSWFFYEAQPTLFNYFGSTNINTLLLINPTPHSKKIVIAQQPVIGYKNLIITYPNKRRKISTFTFHSFKS